jgi:hypothetical protein
MGETGDECIKATFLYHLRRKRAIGEKHVPYDTLKRGFPIHLGKDIKKTADELIRRGIITTKPASYGLQVSLNKERLGEIEQIIRRVLGHIF